MRTLPASSCCSSTRYRAGNPPPRHMRLP
jgi:hypothetical protein